MKAEWKPPVFRMTRRGFFVTLRELHQFAAWMADRAGFEVSMEGVTRVRDDGAALFIHAPPLTAPAGADASKIVATLPLYHFPKKTGVAHVADASRFEDWLRQFMVRTLSSDSARIVSSGHVTFGPMPEKPTI